MAADSTATRARILDGARVRFAQDGYDVTTLMGIAQEAGVTPGTIYHYFDSKPALFVAVGDYVSRTFFDEYLTQVAETSDVRQHMRALLQTFAKLTALDPTITAFMAVWATEVSRYEEIRSIVGGDGLTSPLDYYRQLGKDALEAGQLAPGVDDDMLAGVCISTLFGLAVLVQVGYDSGLTTAACDGLMHLVAGDLLDR